MDKPIEGAAIIDRLDALEESFKAFLSLNQNLLKSISQPQHQKKGGVELLEAKKRLEDKIKNRTVETSPKEAIEIPPIMTSYFTPEFSEENFGKEIEAHSHIKTTIEEDAYQATSVDDELPLTKEELKEVRAVLNIWRDLAEADDENSDEQKDTFDKVVSLADLLIAENKTAPKNKTGKIVRSVWKVAYEELIKIVVRKGIEKAPTWIPEILLYLKNMYNKIN